MIENDLSSSGDQALSNRLTQMEERLSRLEAYLGIPREEASVSPSPGETAIRLSGVGATSATASVIGESELELVVGQSWFARVGIVVLTIGGAFALSLPFPGWHPALPSLVGYLLVGVLFVMARWWHGSFQLVSRYLRGASMALLFISTLRLFYVGPNPVLRPDSSWGQAILVVVVALNLTIALRRGSANLLCLALITGYVTALVVGSAWFVFLVIAILAMVAVQARVRRDWDVLFLFGIGLTYLTHLTWAIYNPFRPDPREFLSETPAKFWFPLIYSLIFATGALFRRDRSHEDAPTIAGSALLCGLGYGLFALHTFATFTPVKMTVSHLAASALFLSLAVVFWLRERSRASTFVFAMTGYAALSIALLYAFNVPNVFVWLSLQSVVVVATALWFRSPFIVVANFVIYLGIVLSYVLTVEKETGVSLGFGVVALVTARVLNWQRQRLQLKTEMMRNAYLASAFFVFPYAFYHLVPRTYVAFAWVAVALVYYLLNFIVRNPKYRWMGHLTLLLTVFYLLIIGIVQFDPAYRVLSFLALGSVLVVVSLVFTGLQSRRRRHAATAVASEPARTDDSEDSKKVPGAPPQDRQT